MNTYKLIKDVIESKNFKMEEMTAKIKHFWIVGDITVEEHDELLSMLPSYLNADAERPENIKLIEYLATKIDELETRVSTLEQGETAAPETETTHEKWIPWDGISDNYQLGAIVEHNGVVYENTLDGQQNVWEPGAPGTELLWKVYIE